MAKNKQLQNGRMTVMQNMKSLSTKIMCVYQVKKHINGKIRGNAVCNRGSNRCIITTDGTYFPGIDLVADLTERRLDQNDHTGYLQTAAGGAGTSTHKHQDNQNHFREGRPQIKIRCGVTRRSDDGGHLEKSVPQRLKGGFIPRQDVDGDANHRRGNNAQIPP